MSNDTVLVFSRSPERGKVKTRIAAAIGDDAALALHRAFLEDTLVSAKRSGANVLLAHTPGPRFAEVEHADEAFEQRDGSFGARVDNALEDARSRCPDGPLIIIGSDTPHLGPESLRAALDALVESDAVLGPSTSGGYYLLGFSGRVVPIAAGFESANEAERTVRLLRAADLRPRLLGPFFDVDVPGDLIGLMQYIELATTSESEWIPTRTARAIDELGLRIVETTASDTRGLRLEIERTR